MERQGAVVVVKRETAVKLESHPETPVARTSRPQVIICPRVWRTSEVFRRVFFSMFLCSFLGFSTLFLTKFLSQFRYDLAGAGPAGMA